MSSSHTRLCKSPFLPQVDQDTTSQVVNPSSQVAAVASSKVDQVDQVVQHDIPSYRSIFMTDDRHVHQKLCDGKDCNCHTLDLLRPR